MDVFEQNNDGVTAPNTEQAAPNQRVDIWVEKLGGITREDGTPKYETVEQALDALKASQDHIARIERENADLASKAQENDTLKQTLERLGGNKMSEEKPAGQPPANGGQSAEAANEELVKRLLNQSLAEQKQIETAINNVKLVQDTLIAKYGPDKTRELIALKAQALNTSPEQLKQLSATNPKLVLEIFGNTPNAPSANSGTVNLGYRPAPDDEIKRPEKSLLSGPAATDRNRADMMKKIREKVYKEHGIL